jgi:hypothetical protein
MTSSQSRRRRVLRARTGEGTAFSCASFDRRVTRPSSGQRAMKATTHVACRQRTPVLGGMNVRRATRAREFTQRCERVRSVCGALTASTRVSGCMARVWRDHQDKLAPSGRCALVTGPAGIPNFPACNGDARQCCSGSLAPTKHCHALLGADCHHRLHCGRPARGWKPCQQRDGDRDHAR